MIQSMNLRICQTNRKSLVSAINFCDVKTQEVQNQLAALKTARQAYVNDLGSRLKEMKIFIGFENEYPEAFEVCAESIRQYNPNHEIIPLIKSELEEQGLYTRPYQGESTEFAFTRFLVPALCEWKGYALFCDGDFMWRCDPQEIEDFAKQSSESPSVCGSQTPSIFNNTT